MSEKGKDRYCKFHRNYGHDTDFFFELMEQIEDFIDRGYLGKYVLEYKGNKVYRDRKRDLLSGLESIIRCLPLPTSGKFPRSEDGRPVPVGQDRMEENYPRGEIKMIFRGPNLVRESARERKLHVQASQAGPICPSARQVNQLENGPPKDSTDGRLLYNVHRNRGYKSSPSTR